MTVEPLGVVRLVDVARQAGVSKATASKALADRYDVNETTKQRVIAAARELNFTPNALASGLGGKKTRSVGLVTSDYEARFFPGIMTGVEDALGSDQSSVILSNTREQEELEVLRIRDLLHRAVDGLIIASPHSEARAPISLAVPVPVVYVYGFSSSPLDTSVIADNHAGGRLAAQHLLDRGRQRLAIVTGPEGQSATRDRAAGALQAIHDAGFEPAGGAPVHGDWSEQWGWDGAAALVDGAVAFDGIVCGDDQIARGVMDLLEVRGLRVPQDVAVIGYDNWRTLSERSRRPFSTVDMDLGEIGRVAAQQVTAPDGPRPGIRLVMPHVVERETS